MDILVGPDGTKYTLSSDIVTIGRDSTNTVSIADEYMSSHHAKIERLGGANVLSDLNSTSGTFVNKQRIGGGVQLSAEDVIRMGQTQFRFQTTNVVVASTAIVNCPKCGSEARVGAKFCATCGNSMEQEPLSPLSPPPVVNQPSMGYQQPSDAGQQVSPNPTMSGTAPASHGQQAGYTPPVNAQPPVTSPQNVIGQQSNLFSPGAKPTRVQFGEALKFPFSSNTWFINLIIGTILMLIPIIGQFLTSGFALDVMRRVIEEDYDALPEWDNWAKKFTDGLAGTAIMIALAVMLFIPFVLPGVLLTYFGAEEIGLPVTGLGLVLLFASLYFLLPFVWGRYVTTNSFTASMQMREVFSQIRRNFGRYLGNWILTGLMLVIGMFVISLLTTIATALVFGLICGIPLIFMTTFYMMLVQYHLMGQLYATVN